LVCIFKRKKNTVSGVGSSSSKGKAIVGKRGEKSKGEYSNSGIQEAERNKLFLRALHIILTWRIY
jgi:hypothetical protein